MLLNKNGFPEESELVLCKVTKVSYNSVFVNLEEYIKHGMIHISEVSPGRIRNLNDYVKVGKMVVCKVLRVNQEKGHIDLSLRRVNENQKRNKNNQIKFEQKAEKIIQDAAKELKVDVKKFYEKVSKVPIEESGLVYPAFEAVIEEGDNLKNLGLEKKETDVLLDLIKQRIKLKQVEIIGDIEISSYAENGVETVKKALNLIAETDKERVSIKYLGASKFRLKIVAHDYEIAESLLEKGMILAKEICEKENAEFKFTRVQQKK